MNNIVWYSGKNNYRKFTLNINKLDVNRHEFITELMDVDTENNDIHTLFYDLLKIRQTKTVEVLYSGGMDSECVLRSCIMQKIPVRAVTGRWVSNNYPINTHDLYYAEKFCRENNVEHKIIDLDVKKFFENGDHIKYIKPYYVWQSHVATHMWLFEQASGFPVFGGEYSWPWYPEKKLSPPKIIFMSYERFLKDNNIHGIGNMLGASLDVELTFIKNHLEVMRSKPINFYAGDAANITNFKRDLFQHMNFGKLEPRMKNYGWELVDTDIINIHKYTDMLIEDYGFALESNIIWNKKIAAVLGCEPGSNNRN